VTVFSHLWSGGGQQFVELHGGAASYHDFA